MYKKSFFMITILSFLLLCLGLIEGCSSANEESGMLRILTKPGINPEYLGLSEKIIIDFYGDDVDRARALETLKTRCDHTSLSDAHACYNLAVLHYNQKNFDDSFVAIQSAVSISPKDPLYLSMLRTMALQLGKPEILEQKEETKVLGTLTRLEMVCGKDDIKTREIMIPLLKEGVLNSTLLNYGGLSECITPQMKAEIEMHGNPSKINYKEIYYQEKIKSDPFSSIWDVGYFIKKKNLDDEDSIHSTLTENWKYVRKYTKAKNLEKARVHLKLFLGELRNHSSQKSEKKKLLALERAAFLLIEQDDFFNLSRPLLQEF
jgi:tetratricopeptide (TPR) repeat protein